MLITESDCKTEGQKTENIELSLPLNPAYVSAARLTASTIANRMNFDIDEIEDVKAAVSEACSFVINKAVAGENETFKIVFIICDNNLSIELYFKTEDPPERSSGDMSLIMIKALMNSVDVTVSRERRAALRMSKTHEPVVFGV